MTLSKTHLADINPIQPRGSGRHLPTQLQPYPLFLGLLNIDSNAVIKVHTLRAGATGQINGCNGLRREGAGTHADKKRKAAAAWLRRKARSLVALRKPMS